MEKQGSDCGMNKLDQLYDLYTFPYADKKSIMETVRITDIKLYYKLQAKIFVDAQKPLYKGIAQMLADDLMKYYNKFEIKLIEVLVDDMQCLDNIPEDVIKANMKRIEVLNCSDLIPDYAIISTINTAIDNPIAV